MRHVNDREHPLFDASRARGPRQGPDVGQDMTDRIVGKVDRGPMTVSALVARIRLALSDAFELPVSVIGQISNCKLHASGHLYFRLKDAASAIDAVMWRSDVARLKFKPVDGLEVIATGRVDVYEVRGQLQLYVQSMTPKGAGALELAFRQLKEKLQAEGLFDQAAKKPIVRFPRAVGVVTSPTGAAIRDIARTLSRRWPAAEVYLAPVLVQGDQAAGTIAEAIGLLDKAARRLKIDTIIVARGGGSLEDLWPFNEELVARAVFAAKTPIISGVGHESDVTICDLVADARAATPTAAAQLAVPDRRELRRHLAALLDRLTRNVIERHRLARAQLTGFMRSVIFRDPTAALRTQVQRVDEMSLRLTATVRNRLADQRRRLEQPAQKLATFHPSSLIERARGRLDRLSNGLAWRLGAMSKQASDRLNRSAGQLWSLHPRNAMQLANQKVASLQRQLEALSYRNVLRRGYSVTRRPDGRIVRSAGDVRRGDLIKTELADGSISSKVTASDAPQGSIERPWLRTAGKRDDPGQVRGERHGTGQANQADV